MQRDEFFYDCCPTERFSNVAFRLHISRRYTFYVMNVILPRYRQTTKRLLLLCMFTFSCSFCTGAQTDGIRCVRDSSVTSASRNKPSTPL